MSLLLSPVKIGNLELKNRIVMAPMCMFCAKKNSGLINDFHLVHYTSRAIGGVGLIIVEATAITDEGKISDSDLGLYNDEQEALHKKLVTNIHNFGAKVAIQIAHAGRKSETTNQIHIAPSAIKFSDDFDMPKQMSLEDIENIKMAFLNTATRAKNAGYDAIELHAAHGYLLNQFLSPITNKRDDKYGGSLENRCSLVIEICKLLKEKVGLTLIVRISATEWMDNGWNLDDSKYLAKKLKGIIDILHVSAGGNNANQKIPAIVPMYQTDYAKQIKDEVNIPVICVGMINSPEVAEALLIGKSADLIGIGRELLRDANFVNKAACIFKEQDKITAQYKRAY